MPLSLVGAKEIRAILAQNVIEKQFLLFGFYVQYHLHFYIQNQNAQ